MHIAQPSDFRSYSRNTSVETENRLATMFIIPEEENGSELLFGAKEVEKLTSRYLDEATKKYRDTIAQNV